MDSSLPILSLSAAAVVSAAAVFPKLQARLALSRAKHRSLSGHSKMSKMVARLMPHYEFDIDDFFCSDGAPADVAMQRRDAFFRLARLYQQRYAKGLKVVMASDESDDDTVTFDQMSEEELLAGIEGLVAPEKNDDF